MVNPANNHNGDPLSFLHSLANVDQFVPLGKNAGINLITLREHGTCTLQ